MKDPMKEKLIDWFDKQHNLKDYDVGNEGIDPDATFLDLYEAIRDCSADVLLWCDEDTNILNEFLYELAYRMDVPDDEIFDLWLR